MNQDLMIYQYYIGVDIKLNTNYHSPIPKEVRGKLDTSASFQLFETKDKNTGTDVIVWYDHGFTGYSGRLRAINLVMVIQQLNYFEAVTYCKKEIFPGQAYVPIFEPEHIEREAPTIRIRTKYKDFELTYWGQYHLTKKDLLNALIFPVDFLQWKYDSYIIKSTEWSPCFVYVCDYGWEMGDNLVNMKILRPNVDKKFKWKGWQCGDYIDNLERVERIVSSRGKLKHLAITSSRKDSEVNWKFCDLPSINAQGEANITIWKKYKDRIINLAENIYVMLDADKKGWEGTDTLCKEIPEFIPVDMRGKYGKNKKGNIIKDQADFVKDIGPYNLKFLTKRLVNEHSRIQ